MTEEDYDDDGVMKSCLDALNDDSILDFLGTLLNDTQENSKDDDYALPDITRDHFETLPFQNIPSNLHEISYCEPLSGNGVIGSKREDSIYVHFKQEDLEYIASKMRSGSAIVPIRRSALNRPNFTINIVNRKIPKRRVHFKRSPLK